MTRVLFDLLKNTPDSRVVSTSNGMQARRKIELESITTSIDRSGPRAYSDSKLANILFTRELQRQFGDKSTVANCFEPGSVKTSFGGFGSDQGFLLNLIYKIAAPFSRIPEQGADTSIWLATSEETKNFRGVFTGSRKIKSPQKQAISDSLALKLWELSEKICDKTLTALRNLLLILYLVF